MPLLRYFHLGDPSGVQKFACIYSFLFCCKRSQVINILPHKGFNKGKQIFTIVKSHEVGDKERVIEGLSTFYAKIFYLKEITRLFIITPMSHPGAHKQVLTNNHKVK